MVFSYLLIPTQLFMWEDHKGIGVPSRLLAMRKKVFFEPKGHLTRNFNLFLNINCPMGDYY